MKSILLHARSHRGNWWALQKVGSERPLSWSLCSTRREARQVLAELDPDLFTDLRVIKVSIAITESMQ